MTPPDWMERMVIFRLNSNALECDWPQFNIFPATQTSDSGRSHQGIGIGQG
ncbi:hypothetical protein [Laspinema olomoucense]|uniref:Uncharacterized protein n=1 Tax=Laspinema olomoucense D3b TaxID=2953688 RepID=A0ABT2N467_9CYAN|nr:MULTISPECIES: hypothetical protein [unclassified Laspinema]MCT7970993.1 hypothetical protein [Laspinema sp. D3d]MCT7976190.1 hypothetical protein [Laspinema sp. D3b]